MLELVATDSKSSDREQWKLSVTGARDSFLAPAFFQTVLFSCSFGLIMASTFVEKFGAKTILDDINEGAISDRDFNTFRSMIYNEAGISLSECSTFTNLGLKVMKLEVSRGILSVSFMKYPKWW